MLCKIIKCTPTDYYYEYECTKDSIQNITDFEDVDYNDAVNVVNFLNSKLVKTWDKYVLLYVPEDNVSIKQNLVELISETKEKKRIADEKRELEKEQKKEKARLRKLKQLEKLKSELGEQ